ncbi:MAG: hypothetical protein U0586_08140 [Candidatus Brocadiaceae bacterium]
MENLKFTNISSHIQKIAEPFFLDILLHHKDDVISLYIIGSAVTRDFHPAHSDINTLIIVKDVQIPFIDFLATLGKRYGKRKLRAPLIMTCNYINRSLEVFPLEFLEMKQIHQLVYGENVLKDIKIEKADVRIQCERELKGKIQHLCQGYIKSMGNRTLLTNLLINSISGYFPIYRGILFLYDQKIPRERLDVIYAMQECCNVDLNIFAKLLELRTKNVYPSRETLNEIFQDLYRVLNTITKKVDEYEINHT